MTQAAPFPLRPWGIILAAGSGSRLHSPACSSAPHIPKQFLPYRDAPLYWHSALTMSRVAPMAGLIFVFPPAWLEQEAEKLTLLDKHRILGLPWHVVAGGARRQDSVNNALHCLKEHVPHCQAVLVHDSARPFASAGLMQRLCQALEGEWAGVIPTLPVTDTIKVVEELAEGHKVLHTPDRATLQAVQTPQAFLFAPLLAAHQQALQENWAVTDDASLMERCGLPVRCIPGEAANRKLTNPEDLSMLHNAQSPPLPCTGFGYDVHRYGPGRPMLLGGVPIPKAPEVIAHSDGDVLLHALMDALLGCACLGDIGQHFPDTDATYENISSAVLLDQVLERLRQTGVRLVQVDVTIIAQTPKVAPHRAAIARNLARLLSLAPHCVNVKATTEEGLGFTGAKEGIKAVALVTALRTPQAYSADETHAGLS